MIQITNLEQISNEELDKYTKSEYRVITMIPYIEKPVKITRVLNQEALDRFLEDYEEYGEFLVDITIQEGKEKG